MDGHNNNRPPRPFQFQPQPQNPSFPYRIPFPNDFHRFRPNFSHNPWLQPQPQPYQFQPQQQTLNPFAQHEEQPPREPQAPGVPLNSPPSQPKSRETTVSMVDMAAVKVRADLRAAGEFVSAWKVSQAALKALNVDSWDSLGFRMQQVPAISGLIMVESKINAYIHCFVAVSGYTTLYDMEVEICKEEGIGKFDELGLGPLVRHPLVIHYFSLSLDAEEVVKISTSETTEFLCSFMRIHSEHKLEVEDFLDFVAKKKNVSSKLKLGIRFQNFGRIIKTLRKLSKSDDSDTKKHSEVLELKKKVRKDRPLFSSLKKQLDERFSSITQRVESFTSLKADFCGKRTKFGSSSSEDEPSNAVSDEDDSDYGKNSQTDFSAQSSKNADWASSCPYPSVNEEMARLGVKSVIDLASPSTGQKHHKSGQADNRKRAREELKFNNSAPVPSKLRKMNNAVFNSSSSMNESNRSVIDLTGTEDDDEFVLSDDALRLFIGIWKERCRGVSVGKVLKRMLRFYRVRDRKKINEIYSTYPFIGVLNVAISSIKLGIWDSIYDTVKGDVSKPLISDACEYESIDVEPDVKDAPVPVVDHSPAVTVEDIIKKVSAYLKLDHGVLTNDKSFLENRFSILRELSKCEHWLAEQLGVKEFRSLGYGEFLVFMEKYASLLPQELHGNSSQKIPLEVSMNHHQLVILLSQALNNIWEDKSIAKHDVSSLLTRQFPCIGFKVVANGSSLNDFLSMALKDKNIEIPKSVIFSITLCPPINTPGFAVPTKNELESTLLRYENDRDIVTREIVTDKDAVELLLKAPMLTDLSLWSHWDLVFAPSCGPLVPWLSTKVKTDELLCLVTRDGKVLRIDPSATAESFLEAAIQGSSFQTAVELLSLFSVAGGQKHVPASLLKCHVQHAFNVILKNSLENGDESSLSITTRELMRADLSCELQNNLSKMNISVSAISRFILDCLCHLPAEIRVFAADIFLSGMQSIVKDGASAILRECSQTSLLVMLHEIGLSLGVVEWINDYHIYRTKDVADMFHTEASGLKPVVSTKMSGSKQKPDVTCTSGRNADGSLGKAKSRSKKHLAGSMADKAEVSGDKISSGGTMKSSRLEPEDAALIIESIRREEFGLDPSISNVESIMLKKQHARLGRALHCLSQELYSQDSHFLLELVQNADDNIYPEIVEPTLTFILQDSSIIVLNNEQGFSAQNIAALCDIGNSTKKGSSAGYIGQKGIGFKSVFRITDAPEIHSNGFHVKFDISEGQIGFVLPTVIPPCDPNLYCKMASEGSDQFHFDQWNTCIVLPFRSRLSDGIVMKNIMSMFSDLHPSLLLFLHRLQCIKFRNLLEDSVIVMRKEIVGDGIINVSHGSEKMTWFVVSENLRSDFIRPDVQSTEISIAFTLKETADGGYCAHLSQQPVFAFLPLRTYGLKFIIQGNFVLPSSREEVDGNSPWNQWLLSEFPGLFIKAQRSFCRLSYFKENPGKAVAAFMSFVPLVGDVHGFFSSLPRMIISKLRVSKCLLLEGDNDEWVLPCKALRGWSEQAHSILPHDLLHQHLGLGFLDKDIVISDALARALGVEEYGTKVLVQFLSSLCRTKNGIRSMSLGWLSRYLAELHSMLEHLPGQTALDAEVEMDFVNNIKKIPFVPLSNGTFSSINEGTIWIQSDSNSSSDGEQKIESFPNLYAKLRIVSPTLLSVLSVDGSHSNSAISDKLTTMLYKIGVQRLSAHEIIKVHILPAISDVSLTKDKSLMTEYVCFVMSHLHTSCHDCCTDREIILLELKNKAYILTNYGFKRPSEVSIHFGLDFGNNVDVDKLIDSADIRWHEVDISYLKHSITKTLPSGLTKWKEFFQSIGVTDFVKVVQVEKTVSAISRAQYKSLMPDEDPISFGSTVSDWESPELVDLLRMLSMDGNKRSCEYLLEVFDQLWDSCFSSKTTGSCTSKDVSGGRFKSTFLSTVCDTQWVISTMDNKLHYPRELYYDCDAVRSVLGASAPYAVPKVKNGKLVDDIGLRNTVSLEDIIAMLKEWSCKTTFTASLTQMSKLYAFIWNEVAASKKYAEELQSEPFIFVPHTNGTSHEAVLSGEFLSPREVYWRDSTGAIDRTKEMLKSSKGVTQLPLNKTLFNIYPSLHDFFVIACGVHEEPSLPSYLKILLQLSNVALPSQAYKAVFQVLLKWTDGLNAGLSPEDVLYLKNSIKKEKFAVLPTKQDKWVSLHHSFGLICWIDDEKLKKHFKHMEGIDFLYFGKLSEDEEEVYRTKVSVLMKALEIPALSEVVSREAVHDGVEDSSFKASLVNWALPYAQRYLNVRHPDRYSQLNHDCLNRLRVIAVEQLFYRNVIKSCGGKSEKRTKCSCLLEDTTLYTTQEPDSHALFLELSRLFFSGTPDLHMANFLHMIMTMAESGCNEEKTEVFILNTQKIPKLPDGESVWSLPPVSHTENEGTAQPSQAVDEPGSSKSSRKKRKSNPKWPPADWNTAPGFGYARQHGFWTQSAIQQPDFDSSKQNEDEFKFTEQIPEPFPINGDWTIEEDSRPASTALALAPDSANNLGRPWLAMGDEADLESPADFNPIGLESAVEVSNRSSEPYKKGYSRMGGQANEQASLTGRIGEEIAFKYFAAKFGSKVTWINRDRETGLPYDLLIKDADKNGNSEYIEVKATISQRKNWLMISLREWQFATEKGDAFSIAHVVLTRNGVAKVSVFKNPVRLLEQRRLRLVIVMPGDQEFSLVS